MAKHMPGASWPFRHPSGPRSGWVRTRTRSTVQVMVYTADNLWITLTLTRTEARMLARRINQCLEYTR